MNIKEHCRYCRENLGGKWLRSIGWAGHICHTCYGTGSRFDHWVARALYRFRAVLNWRNELGGGL